MGLDRIRSNTVTVDADVPANANGVIYSLGGFSGGLATYMQDGMLCYEYNLFEIDRTRFCTKEKLPAGRAKIEVETVTKPKPGPDAGKSLYQSANITVRVTPPITAIPTAVFCVP